jgi:hypothetical protein
MELLQGFGSVSPPQFAQDHGVQYGAAIGVVSF